MLPSVGLHGLAEPKVRSLSDQPCTPAQSVKLAPRIDVAIDRAPVICVAVVDLRDDEGVEVGSVLEVPGASSSIIKFSICMCHRLVSRHRRNASRI